MLSQNGWRRNLLCFALGVCATLTLAPFYVFPFIIPAYGGLFLLLRGAETRKRAFADGWWWGWGFYITGLYWFCIALLTEPEKFAWAIPFCLFGLNAIIALYPALACVLFYSFCRKKPNVKRCVVLDGLSFSLIWLLVEYARSHFFTGFPWNLAGYSFGFSDVSLQLASLVGIYGLTFFTVLLAVSAVAVNCKRMFTLVVWGGLIVGLLWGFVRLEYAVLGDVNGVRLRLVQAGIEQHHKWDPELQQKHLHQYTMLMQSDGLEKINYVVWPETAVPYPLREGSVLAQFLGTSLPVGGKLITGAMRVEGPRESANFYNSVMALDHNGKIIGNYDKHALVPFGEFLPLRYLIPKSIRLPVGDTDFSRGQGVQTLHWDGLPPISVLVCYEAIFAEYAVNAAKRPELLLNLTNDAWFGNSSGPHQHFQMARMRAVEQGIALVRVANTGITAYIDEYGRIQQKLDLGSKGILDVELRKPIVNYTTYTRYADFLMWITICFVVILFCINIKLGWA